MVIEPLQKHPDRVSVRCGETSLDDFLTKFARQNDERGLGRTYVCVEPPSTAVIGYYTLSIGAIQFDEVPENLPRYPIPMVHLGRLAVDSNWQKQKLGQRLLIDALARADRVAAEVGVYAIEVRALHEQARTFYQRFGFTPLLDDPLHLYMSMKHVRKLGLNPPS